MLVLEDLRTFRDLLKVSPDAIEIEEDEPFKPETLYLADLFQYRDKKWLPPVIALKTRDLQFYAIGRGPELADVASAYANALNSILKGASEETVNGALRSAEQKLDALEAESGARREYFDGMERIHDAASRELMMQWYAPKGSLERSRQQRYIDDFERRF